MKLGMYTQNTKNALSGFISNMPPAAKKAKRSLCDITDLSDNDLSEIFKWLPPYERLIASEVCRRWQEVSRKAWLDITKLDLSPIPLTTSIAAIIKQCPKLGAVFASRASFALNELSELRKVQSISSVKFYGCEFELDKPVYGLTRDFFQKIFSRKLWRASWIELVLHDAYFWHDDDDTSDTYDWHLLPKYDFNLTFLPVSLTRLQISGVYCHPDVDCSDEFLLGLERLTNLECFILHTTPMPLREFGGDQSEDLMDYGLVMCRQDIFDSIRTLKNLKEFCFGSAKDFYPNSFMDFIASLPKLEVLFINNLDSIDFLDQSELEQVISENAVLRILVLSGEFVVDEDDEQLVIPARKRFPKGLGSDPLPLLHIFVGREASENIIFEKSPLDAAIIHPINVPMPEFLKREDIAPIFEGVWVAERIKEAAENGARLWDYALHDNASSVRHPDE